LQAKNHLTVYSLCKGILHAPRRTTPHENRPRPHPRRRSFL